MYTKLMEQSQRTAAFQRGATMIAAGLSPYQDTRDALLATVGKGGAGAGAGGISMEQMINLQKMQEAEQERNLQRAQLPALQKQYNLDPATVQYLDSTGQLDETIAELNKPHTQVVQSADKGNMLIDTRDGHLIKQLSPDAPRETEFIDAGDGNHILVDKATKVPVGSKTGNPIVFTGPTLAEKKLQLDIQQAPAELDIKKGALDVSRGNLAVAQSAEQRALAEAKVKEDSRQIRALYLPALQKQFGITEATANYLNETDQLDEFIKEASKPNTQIIEAADGSQLLVSKDTGALIRTLSPPKDELATARAAVEALNVEEKAAGRPLTTVGDWIKTHGTGSGSPLVQIGPNGDPLPPLEKDYRYITENGKPKWFPADDTGPAGYRAEPVPGTAAAAAAEKSKQELEAGAKKAEKSDEAAAEGKGYQFVQNYVVNEDAGKALDLIKEHHGDVVGITGWGGLKAGLPNDPATTLAGYLDTVQTFVELKKLDTMRANSPTGAALGNVTEKENAMLRSVMGKFNQKGEEHVLVYNLKRFKLATEMLANGIVDKSLPVTKDNPHQVRLPTETELRDALDNIPKDDLEEGVPTKGPDNVTVTKRKVTRTKPPED
jgi:hypothetical protein